MSASGGCGTVGLIAPVGVGDDAAAWEVTRWCDLVEGVLTSPFGADS
jgi:hypothetical protein